MILLLIVTLCMLLVMTLRSQQDRTILPKMSGGPVSTFFWEKLYSCCCFVQLLANLVDFLAVVFCL